MKSADLEDALADFNSAEIKDAMADSDLKGLTQIKSCLLYTSPSPRDRG